MRLDILDQTANAEPKDDRPMTMHSQVLSIETVMDALIDEPRCPEKSKYAEMGVPMFLIGEHATFDANAPPIDDTATNEISDYFRQLVGAMARRKPEIDHEDVAKLLEALADRYFMTGKRQSPVDEVLASPVHHLLPPAPPVLAELAVGMAHSRAIRLVNFHATPRYREAEFRRQIEACAEIFEPITPENFAAAVEGRWEHSRPGLMPALFEGYRDNIDVLLPILEQFGFTGWFFLPSGFLNVPAHEQRSYAASHRLHLPEQDEYPGERIVLTWDEAREIARRGHVFACHTRSHREVRPETPRDVLENEIVAAKAEMEAQLGVGVDIFCWLEGAAIGVNAEADAMLRDAGFRYLFSNFKIQQLQ